MNKRDGFICIDHVFPRLKAMLGGAGSSDLQFRERLYGLCVQIVSSEIRRQSPGEIDEFLVQCYVLGGCDTPKQQIDHVHGLGLTIRQELWFDPLLEVKRLDLFELDAKLLPDLSPQSLIYEFSRLDASSWKAPLSRKDASVRGLLADQNATFVVEDQGYDDQALMEAMD